MNPDTTSPARCVQPIVRAADSFPDLAEGKVCRAFRQGYLVARIGGRLWTKLASGWWSLLCDQGGVCAMRTAPRRWRKADARQGRWTAAFGEAITQAGLPFMD